MEISRETAAVIGIRAAAWLVGNDELRPVFMGATGVSEDDFRDNLEDPDFQGSVLDFLLMDDGWVVAFCDEIELPYDQLRLARESLPGGQRVHWT